MTANRMMNEEIFTRLDQLEKEAKSLTHNVKSYVCRVDTACSMSAGALHAALAIIEDNIPGPTPSRFVL